MTVEQKIALLAVFEEVDAILIREMNKLLDSGIVPNIDGDYPDPRWRLLREIQFEKEEVQDRFEVLGKDAWSFESKMKIAEQRNQTLLRKLRDYQDSTT